MRRTSILLSALSLVEVYSAPIDRTEKRGFNIVPGDFSNSAGGGGISLNPSKGLSALLPTVSNGYSSGYIVGGFEDTPLGKFPLSGRDNEERGIGIVPGDYSNSVGGGSISLNPQDGLNLINPTVENGYSSGYIVGGFEDTPIGKSLNLRENEERGFNIVPGDFSNSAGGGGISLNPTDGLKVVNPIVENDYSSGYTVGGLGDTFLGGPLLGGRDEVKVQANLLNVGKTNDGGLGVGVGTVGWTADAEDVGVASGLVNLGGVEAGLKSGLNADFASEKTDLNGGQIVV